MPPRSWVNSSAHDLLVATLIAERTGAGLTQRQLADRLGKDPATIARIETGQRNISVLEFVVIIQALGRSPTDVLGRLIEDLPID